MTGGGIEGAQAQQAFSPAWFAAKGAAQSNAAATGYLPNGTRAALLADPAQQQQQANAQLQRSLNNLGALAQGIAAQQAAQEAARQAALANGGSVPDGLTEGGLKVDTNSLTRGWLNASAPVQSVANGKTTVSIAQNADKAILNWETFHVGKNTLVNFQQQANWAVLNRVNDPQARPSQIQGQINAPGTVMIVNRNGIVFAGGSQVNTRNLAAAAANITNVQFQNNGLYGASGTAPTFTDALGKVEVQAGARIATHEPQSVTQGGGYVILLGQSVSNQGGITTRKGQALLAAGDSFVIRKGAGTDANQYSTVRGSEVMPGLVANSNAGEVVNQGVIIAREGDVTLAGHTVRQEGVALASTTVNTRGTVHLLNSATDKDSSITLAPGAITAVVIEDDGKTTALDSQRDALIKESASLDQQRNIAATNAGSSRSFDNYSTLSDRRDLSRIEIVGGGNVRFEGGSLTLATGGQLAVSSGNSASGTKEALVTAGSIHVSSGAVLDVSGYVGAKLAMESNNIRVNVQGNELRDAPMNRDAGKLFNNNLWLDRRDLILVPAGTSGYESDRWYSAGGLLEVSGYLGNQGHGIAEWAAQGGTINLTGDRVVARAGSSINLSGGTLDVASGMIRMSWLKGSDGRLYRADNAPADLTYQGIYNGFQVDHPRWKITETYYNPLIGPQSRMEEGYTVGRDAGRLDIWSANVRLEADIDASVYNGPRQTGARPAGAVDAYKLRHNQAALPGRLLLQTYDPGLDPNLNSPRLNRIADVRLDNTTPDQESTADSQGSLVWLNLDRINRTGLGALAVDAKGTVSTGGDLVMAPGGTVDFQGGVVLGGSVIARGGSIRLAVGSSPYGDLLGLTIGSGFTLDTRGLWTNTMRDPASAWQLAFINGGTVQLTSSGVMTLARGSRIDTSAGGALLANGKSQGGNGGDISLNAGGLVIDSGGAMAGYGFGKGGKLSIVTPAAISIGGPLTRTSGQLAAGEKAVFDMIVSENFRLPAGYRLPVELNVSTGNFIALGKEVQAGAQPYIAYNRPLVVGPRGWVTPIDYVFARDPITKVQAHYPAGSLIPAGYEVVAINNQFPTGYVMPVDAFTTPIPIYARVITYAAGTVLSAPLTVTAGTVLSRGTTLSVSAPVLPVFEINDANAFFQQGFASYNLSGLAGLIVQPGIQMEVAMPVYRFAGASPATGQSQQGLAGDALAQAAEIALPALFAEDALKRTLKQRGGADVALTGGIAGLPIPGRQANPLSSGAIIIGDGAKVSVDPGRRISLTSKGQIDIEGSLVAPGGSITVVNTRTIADVELAHRIAFPNDYGWASDDPSDAMSVWIGSRAVLDAAGRAYTALDAMGKPYGVVFDGGSVLLGGGGGNDPNSIGGVLSSASYVVVRPGARIDVAGAGASLAQRGVARQVASNGGAITVSSSLGFFLDGEMRAQGGGAGASGGSLSLVLEAPTFVNVYDGNTRAGRVLYVSQNAKRQLAEQLEAGQADAGYVPGRARISAEQIGQGGFDSLSLWGRTAIAFDGNVDLHLGRSLVLQQGSLYQTTAGASVNLSAPYVMFDGGTLLRGWYNQQYWTAPTRLPAFAEGGNLTVNADLIDLRNAVRSNFIQTTLRSSGDMRFLVSTAPPPDAELNASGIGTSQLRGVGDIELDAGQIYPDSGVVAQIYAGGLASSVNGRPSRLVIGSTRAPGDVPNPPYSLFGSLTLTAGTIEQGGVVRAPFGTLAFNAKQQVDLLPGSITSISTRGLVMPFGGTVDGVTYTYNGVTAPMPDASGAWSGTFSVGTSTQYGVIGLTISSPTFHIAAGSLIDVSGGGQLTGGAFVTGRGGSVDTLINPLNADGKVYALVPGAVVAPTAGGYSKAWSGATPGIGQQITLPGGVPGLPAGTYTLMPANYALLPGAWRVELGGRSMDSVDALALRNGSYLVSGVQGIANTVIRDSLNTLVTLTPGPVLRTYSAYNEQGYSQFQQARMQTFGTPRPLLEADGKRLEFDALISAANRANNALVFNGQADFSAARGGRLGNFTLAGTTGTYTNQPVPATLVITGAGSTTGNDASTITVSAADIGKVRAPNLYLGGPVGGYPHLSMGGVGGNFMMLDNLVVESGVTLSGGQVALGANKKVTMMEGASINTLGQGQTAPDSSNGLLFGALPSLYSSYAMLLVSNGRFTLNAPSGLFGTNIELRDGVSLYSEGTVGFYADLGVSLIGTPRIGTRNLSLAVPSFNIGTDAALAAAQAGNGSLPAGMNLNQRILDTLFAGRPAEGVPAIENLSLIAGKSINFFGSVDLNTLDPATGKSRLAQFTFNTPALYGYGGAGDTVRLTADTLVWTDTLRSIVSQANTDTRYGSTPPGAPIAGALGSGALRIDANRIIVGNAAQSNPDTSISYDRLMLGFSDVYFNATERITGNAKNSLSVYRSGADPSTAFDPATYAGTAGNLHLSTPLLTGDPGSVIGYYTGGRLSLEAPAGTVAAAVDQVGATLNLRAQSIAIASAIVLPSGRLTLTADQDVTLADGAVLDVSGRQRTYYDVKRATWGGDIVIESRHGNITQAGHAVIDVSAAKESAGTLKAAALEGRVQLGGNLRGNGAQAYAGGAIDLRAQRIGDSVATLSSDFAAFNARLNDAGFSEGRSFALRQGDLTIGDELRAHDINVSLDGGSLTVNGRIDASGVRAGSIRLAARDDVRLTGAAVLDAHGDRLQVDSYGQAIEAKNRGIIELGSSQGWLRLDSGAAMDVSAPGVAYGRIALNARRASETGGDILIDASGPVNIAGARSIAVNGFWTYSPTDADGTVMQDNGGSAPVNGSGQVGLDQIDARSQSFYANALANGVLQARLAGLRAYGAAYHMRPGVEITSTGKLTVKGDIDLAGYRYGPQANRNPASPGYGAGEPLALSLRAAGDLNIKGSISDGFGKPKATPDDSSILLQAGRILSADYTLPESVTLAAGTKIGSGTVLPFDVLLPGGQVLRAGQAAASDIVLHPAPDQDGNRIYPFGGTNSSGELRYPVLVVSGQVEDWNYNGMAFGPGDTIYYPLGDSTTIRAGTVLQVQNGGPASYADLVLSGGPKVAANKPLPQQVVLDNSYTLAAALNVTGTIVTSGQTYTAGMTIPAGTVLPQGTSLGAGAMLPFDFDIQSTTWRAGNPLILVGGYTLDSSQTLQAGTVLRAGSASAATVYASTARPVWAVAPMLAAGSQSASIRLVGGADLSAADSRGMQSAAALRGAGNILLNDPRVDNSANMPIFSVIRTGTGELDLLAGGNLSQATPFGVYTAGTQSDLASGNAAFNPPRASLIAGASSITGLANYDAALNSQATWFPDHGGDLLISVQRNLSGNIWSDRTGLTLNGAEVAPWLWHQGAAGMGHAPAWSINFGTYISGGVRYDPVTQQTYQIARVAGFAGYGTLGGGNATLRVDGDAGLLSAYNPYAAVGASSTGLIVAVAATGRVTQSNTLVQTGGGDLVMKIGGALNGAQASVTSATDIQGVLTDLRGDINVSAGAIGGMQLTYGTKPAQDPRGADLYTAQSVAQFQSGPSLVPGDGAVRLRSRGDLVMASYEDAPMQLARGNNGLSYVYSFQGNLLANGASGVDYNWFSLWTRNTSIALTSAGGNLMPFSSGYLPPNFSAVAASGNLYYGSELSNNLSTVELLPSPNGQLELLATGSIYAAARQAGLTLGMSGARAGVQDMPNPFKPAWVVTTQANSPTNSPFDPNCQCNTNTLVRVSPPQWPGGPASYSPSFGYFAFQAGDTPTSLLHAGDSEPIRLYAVNGDIVGAVLGGTSRGFDGSTSYMVAKPAQVRAGRDVVGFGVVAQPGGYGNTGSYLMNVNASDASVIEAGRDIFYANLNMAGPGVLEVTAGRNLYQGDGGSLVSLGSVIPGDVRQGADIAVTVGAGVAGPDYAALKRYLDPANQADLAPGHPLADQAGKVAHTYQEELIAWLAERYGDQAAGPQDALARFNALAVEQQHVFLRSVYFSELRAGGREYNDVDSSRYGSYLRGRQAIAVLFPGQGSDGAALVRGGDFTQFGASGIQTRFGGDIQMLAPAGKIVVGTQGTPPPATSGLITQGSGDIELYSQDSILLGLSRIMTTFGGGILAWSAQGDINAGRGSKTTLVYTPPKREYDTVGNVKLSPQVPSTGAGIATLNPIAEIAPGDVDLIAPQGTIDAGEAGIRVSGNINVAALQVVNAANIQVQGKSAGLPVVAAVNVGALTNASAAASAAAMAAQDTMARDRAAARQNLPSVFTVRVLGFGGGDISDEKNPAPAVLPRSSGRPYDPRSPLQFVGVNGDLDPEQVSRLSAEERRRLPRQTP